MEGKIRKAVAFFQPTSKVATLFSQFLAFGTKLSKFVLIGFFNDIIMYCNDFDEVIGIIKTA